MRTRRYANNERIRAKDRRLVEVLKRQDFARTLSMFPAGIVGSLSHSTPIGSTTSTINTPLLALVNTAQETWKVDFATIPDPTGGYQDVTIEPGKQIGELETSQVISFTGRPSGNYIIYATHLPVNENPETRNPPGRYAGGTGVFPEHRAFFSHGQSDGVPIPREAYDDTLTPEVISEHVDRLTISISPEASVPVGVTRLLEVAWSGGSVTAVTNIAQALDINQLFNHIGSGGNAHAQVTTSTDGFMSAADKLLLDQATHARIASSLMRRDSSNRSQVADPSDAYDIANKGYVDGMFPVGASDIASTFRGTISRIRIARVGTPGSTPYLPSGWTWASLASPGVYRITPDTTSGMPVTIGIVGGAHGTAEWNIAGGYWIIRRFDSSGNPQDGSFHVLFVTG